MITNSMSILFYTYKIKSEMDWSHHIKQISENITVAYIDFFFVCNIIIAKTEVIS